MAKRWRILALVMTVSLVLVPAISAVLDGSHLDTDFLFAGQLTGAKSSQEVYSGTLASQALPELSSEPLLCAANFVDKKNMDATNAISDCVRQKVSVVEFLPGRYYIAGEVEMGSRSNVTLRTRGVQSGPACLGPGAANCAIFTATANNPGPRLFHSKDASNVMLSYVAIDGNNAPRTLKMAGQFPLGAYNANFEQCSDCKFIGFASVSAAQGTGLAFTGKNGFFDNTLFRDNGWGQINLNGTNGQWSDGLTVNDSENVHITNSVFMDNSDINLIVGNGPNAVIENNDIINTYNYAFGGLMLDNFNDVNPGDFTGAVVRKNRVQCGMGMCGIGINLGPHMWYPSKPITGGEISDNSVVGARQGILVNGAKGMTIVRNSVRVHGLYSGSGCGTNFLSISTGDSVTQNGNDLDAQSVSPSGLEKCYGQPQILSSMLSTLNGTDRGVALIYREVLGRDHDASGGAYHTQLLRSGQMTIESIRRSVADSPEAETNLNNMYLMVFGRPIDPGGLKFWRDYLANGGTFAKLYMMFRTSDEGVASTESFSTRAR